jgi:hypothetical protein
MKKKVRSRRNREGWDLRRTKFLNAQRREPLSHIHSGIDALALDEAGHKAAGESVASAVGVVNLLCGDGVDGVLLDLILALDGDDGRFGALGDDSHAGPLGVLLWQVGQGLGDGGDVVLDVAQAVRLGVGGRLGLVADDVVPVRRRRVQGVLEELGDERCRQVHDEDLVLGRGLFGQGHDGWWADCFDD